ncbi:MAG TPA: VIT and VWA domain-containing protein [Gemmataceae bacterium]|jgi:Ca-activated chloride channel family protein|nr:VIT and VWA domain-containing protein [Gemmataceae bacterium]
MFNSRAYFNSRPDGFGVLEIVDESAVDGPRQFAPLARTDLTGEVTGPLASLRLTQTFRMTGPTATPIEVLYRFPLPGDAAVIGVRVRFGDVVIQTTLKERAAAEADYDEAKGLGRQAALLTRESPDVFTLAVAGIHAGQDVRVETEYVQLARAESGGWSLRIPLTTSPRYVRSDEAESPHAAGQPLAILRDPDHRFALDLVVRGGAVASSTHTLSVDGERVRLRDGDVLPDRDCVLTWKPATSDRPALTTWVQPDPATGRAYFLALCAPPARTASVAAREVIVLVDHSGSMSGPKWEAADWAVERFLSGLTEHDAFALGVFHTTTRWLANKTIPATRESVAQAVHFLKASKDNGGTELGVALEQALDLPRATGTRARHVLIITDAEVSDSGRLLRLADAETVRTDRRRLSVLCIDAAPNATLATELAERGGGVSRFLTSNPNENDVTTALDEVLADWAAPEHIGLTLTINRPATEAVGRSVSLHAPGPATAIDLGDPPAGRPFWVAGRTALAGGALKLQLGTPSGSLAECVVDPAAGSTPGLKPLFGAERIRRLEYLMESFVNGDALQTELDRLGYTVKSEAESKVYAENTHRAGAEVVREILVRESLDFGLASAATAFVAVRTESGQRVSETLVVANALPDGWSTLSGGVGGRGSLGAASMIYGDVFACAAPAAPPQRMRLMKASAPPAASYRLGGSSRYFSDGDTTTDFDCTSAASPATPATTIHVAAGQHAPGDGTVLLDSAREALTSSGRLSSLSISSTDPALTADAIGPELTILVFIGDLTSPRASIRLADVLRQGGRRPLNLRRAASEELRLVIRDPEGKWHTGMPAVTMVLDWEA